VQGASAETLTRVLDEIDQSYLPAIINACRELLAKYPTR